MTKQALLIINLGSPDTPTPDAVKRYLIQFLTDSNVLQIPYLFRQLLVRGQIIPKRLIASTQSYQTIWMQEGSPLKVHTERFAKKLEKKHSDLKIFWAMRYQSPSIEAVLKQIKQEQIDELLVWPMFPQFAQATTGSILEEVSKQVRRLQLNLKLKTIEYFYNHKSYINSFAQLLQEAVQKKDYDFVLFSYHGLPVSHLLKVDKCNHCKQSTDCCERIQKNNAKCYQAQCLETTKRLVEATNLNLPYRSCFQSRLGKDQWIGPYTQETILELARLGKKNVLILSPAFVADCLETLYELEIEYAHLFKKAGGESLDLVHSLNDGDDWVDQSSDLIHSYLGNPRQSVLLELLPS